GDQAGAEIVGRIEIVSLGGPEQSRHFFRLSVARAPVIEYGVANDGRAGRITAYGLAPLTDVAAEFQLEIHCFAKARPLKLIVDTDYCKAVAFVIDRLSVKGLDYPVIGTRVHRFQRCFWVRRT